VIHVDLFGGIGKAGIKMNDERTKKLREELIEKCRKKDIILWTSYTEMLHLKMLR